MRLPALVCVLALAILSACADEAGPPDVTRTAVGVTAATVPSEASSSAVTSPNATLPPGLTQARVTRVVDGDTIGVEIDGTEYTLRYIGIDAPETVRPNTPVECFGPEASAFNRQLVQGQIVGLERDTSDTDDFGRLLRYAWLGGEMVNARLVEGGFARAIRYPPDTRNNVLFESLQPDAQADRRVLWGATCPSLTPIITSSAATPPVTTGGPCEFSGTEEAVIKGNISRNDSDRIYHVPGQNDYEATRINENAGERWFCTESDAVAAGWRRAQR